VTPSIVRSRLNALRRWRIYRGALLLLSALLLSPALPAKDMYGQFAVFGPGAGKCSDYLRVRTRDEALMQRWHDWIAGYLSGFNLIVEQTYNILGERQYSEALDWLDRQCQQAPNKSFINALAEMTQAYYPARRSFVSSGKPWGTGGAE